MWCTDVVRGHNNVIGATLFPHNIGLGGLTTLRLLKKLPVLQLKK
ncbi:MAG: beta-glucosidase [Colwellia sp.]|jgi:beta-glucosidase